MRVLRQPHGPDEDGVGAGDQQTGERLNPLARRAARKRRQPAGAPPDPTRIPPDRGSRRAGFRRKTDSVYFETLGLFFYRSVYFFSV